MVAYFIVTEKTKSGIIQKIVNSSASLSEAMLNCYLYGAMDQRIQNDSNMPADILMLYHFLQFLQKESDKYTANHNEEDNYWNIKLDHKDSMEDSFGITKEESENILNDMIKVLKHSQNAAEFVYNYLERTDVASYKTLFYTLYLIGLSVWDA